MGLLGGRPASTVAPFPRAMATAATAAGNPLAAVTVHHPAHQV